MHKWFKEQFLSCFSLVDSTANNDILQECLEGLNIGPETGTPISSAHLLLTRSAAEGRIYLIFFSLENSFSLFPTFPTEGTAGFEPSPEQQRLQPQAVIGGCMLPGQQQYPVTFEGAAGEDQLPEQPAHPKEEAEGGACGGQLAEQFLHTMNMTSDGDHFSELETAAPPSPNMLL